MNLVIAIALAALFTLIPAAAFALKVKPDLRAQAERAGPATTTVASPQQFNVGDAWTYARPNGTEDTWTVKKVSGSSVIIERGSSQRTYVYSFEGNMVQGYTQSGREVTFTPSTQDIKFPLQEGKSWDVTYSGTGTVVGRKRGDERPRTWEFRAQGRVRGLEEITVPAGTFKAWKIEHRLEGGDGDDALIVRTCWYAEETKRFVKCEFETHPGWSFVLVKYVLPK